MADTKIDSININQQLLVYQGDTFTFEFDYLNLNKTAIDLTGATAEMRIRRSPESLKYVGLITSNYPNGAFGPSGGYDFSETGGATGGTTGGTGGIQLNYNGVTGSVYIVIDNETTKNMPARRNFYDLEITKSDGEVKTILKGTFELSRETTR